MKKTRKAPLAEILKKAGRASPGCPVFCGISTEEYFFELSRADTSLEEIYLDEICAYSRDDYGLEMPVIGTVESIGRQPAPVRNALLYKILVEPFVRMEELKNMICSMDVKTACHAELKDILCDLGVKEEDFK